MPKHRLFFLVAAVLKDAGWRPDLPEALAKKIEAAWASTNRPNSTAWKWWWIDSTRDDQAKELDAFLAKTPALDKYIKDFMATLSADGGIHVVVLSRARMPWSAWTPPPARPFGRRTFRMTAMN